MSSQTKTAKKKPTSYEGTIVVYLHRVTFSFWWDAAYGVKLNREARRDLRRAAYDRAKYGIRQGCHCGDLLAYVEPNEVRGWWEIERE